jgi:hypothetical protein
MTDSTWTEVSCTRAINGDLFSQGVIDFPFSIGYPNTFIPSKSYFRATLQLNRGITADAPLVSDMVGFSENPAGNLFSTCEVKMGGVQVSKTTSFAQQASMLKLRSGSSYAFLKSIGADCNQLNPSLSTRIQSVSSDVAIGSKVNSDNYITKPLITYRVALAAGVATFTNPAPGVAAVENTNTFATAGDELVIAGQSFIVRTTAANATLTVTSASTSDIAATLDFYFVKRNITRTPQAHNIIYAVYQPPCGFFDESEPMCAGDYRVSLNPNSYYKKAIVQSIFNLSQDPILANYNVSVIDVKFYLYTEKQSIVDCVRTMNLYEMSIQNKLYSENLQFTIPSSTQKISIFMQSPEANYSNIYPPSRFSCPLDVDLGIKSIQLSYAGVQKTSTLYESSFTSVGGLPAATSYTNQLQQRFIESNESFNKDASIGCGESYSDWLERGPIFHFDFTRDETDRSTELQLNIQSISQAAGLDLQKVFVVAWYRSRCEYETQGGTVTAVKMSSI